MVTRRAFLSLVGAAGAAGVATVAGIQLLPGESAPTGDPVVRYGKENCARCRMTISDARFAAAWREPGGKEKHFDDIGCMVLLQRDNGVPETTQFWVNDYETETWLDAASASYVLSKAIDSPMAYGIAASATPDRAEALSKRFESATVSMWDGLDSSVAARG
ncbi:MAG: nitrous oxide reductase accessory protein NosL [Dehalococcoidia bacterium]|nr:nitrous oxide reductase accessory protein NosL [Dehalococcoidia bacterium]MCB9484570.1 nitrous oxide reductase accessory protein NosL [Thermoflexaceae bacterium]